MNVLEKYYRERWTSYNGESELIGLTLGGFTGSEELCVSDWNTDELDWAYSFAKSCGEPVGRINKNWSSYQLKHLAEIMAQKLERNPTIHIFNGALILAMVDAGFRFVKDKENQNAYFNVSERQLKKLAKLYGYYHL